MRKKRRRPAGHAISATEAAKHFGRLVDRVREERAVYVIERGGRPVAEIGPAAGVCAVRDLVAHLRARRPPDEAYLKEVEAGIAVMNRPALPEDRWES